ncbi:unnamed protein product [Brassica oleracea]|uniref:(rape) hypothetical protein n=1 Tax=Brassica napus TaxID=3708 RepID=A0A816J6R0_BRANA|nr:unnamed protein product [Brassica napus]
MSINEQNKEAADRAKDETFELGLDFNNREKKYELDAGSLDGKYKDWQKKLHPDLVHNKVSGLLTFTFFFSYLFSCNCLSLLNLKLFFLKVPNKKRFPQWNEEVRTEPILSRSVLVRGTPQT